MNKSDFLNVEDIVGQYVQLTPEGDSYYLGKCPFCSSEENSLVLSRDTQYWSCLSCGVNGDRYDFVAKSEKISRAEAILLVGHHTNTGEPFPHARFKAVPAKAEAPKPKRPAAAAAPPPSAKPPESSPTQPPKAATGGAETAAPFVELQNIIPSYQGAALLDNKLKMIASDGEYSFSADLAGVGILLAPGLVHAATLFSKWGLSAFLPATLTLASEELAILMHKFGAADKPRLLLLRLANPSDAAMARRLVASVSAKLT